MFSEGRSSEKPLLLGSVKTNLGHCEGASGLAAVIKAVLCLEHAYIPPTVGVKRLNPSSTSKHLCWVSYSYANAGLVNFRDGSLKVVENLTPWPQWLEYLRASVNGFGYGGKLPQNSRNQKQLVGHQILKSGRCKCPCYS